MILESKSTIKQRMEQILLRIANNLHSTDSVDTLPVFQDALLGDEFHKALTAVGNLWISDLKRVHKLSLTLESKPYYIYLSLSYAPAA